MLSACFLYFNLISAAGLAWPDPYFGFGMGIFPNRRYDNSSGSVTSVKERDRFLSFGLPFRLFSTEETGWRSIDYIFTPELGVTSTIVQFNLTFGPEFEKSMGYRSRLSGIVLSVQGGLHYASLVAPSDPIRADGSEFSDGDKNSVAFLLNAYFGPRFVLSDNVALRFLFNPHVIMGQIAPRTFGTKKYEWLGYTMNFNLQLEFSRWLREQL